MNPEFDEDTAVCIKTDDIEAAIDFKGRGMLRLCGVDIGHLVHSIDIESMPEADSQYGVTVLRATFILRPPRGA